MNHITLVGNKLIVRFKFDPKIVAEVRKIDGREWNGKESRWEIPAENVEEALRILLPLGFTPSNEVKAAREAAEKQFAEIDAIKAAPDAPYEGRLPLLDFQRKGYAFLKNMPSAGLGDVPGTGKTIQTIAATEHEPKILWWTMNSLTFTTEEEIKKWLPDAKVLVIHGDKDERREQWVWAKDPRYKYVIANYELLIHDFEHVKDFEWACGVCDEATRISNPGAKSVQNLKALNIKKKIFLTGTPISNSPEDIFSLVDWIFPRYLGTFYQFRQKYCEVEEGWGQGRSFERITGYKNLEELSKKVERVMLRRTKAEVLKDLPPKTIEHLVFTLSDSERKMYQAIKEQVIEEVRKLGNLDTRTLGIVPVKMLRLKQCTDHLKLVDAHTSTYCQSTKFELLKAKLEEIVANGDKAIVFTQFAEMLYIMKEKLEHLRPMAIYGDVDSEERMVNVKEFNDDPKGRIILMTEAGAYGLNMQSARYVFHYDAPWSISKLDQREDRAHRKGQEQAVTVYHMIAKDTIDEYVLKILKKKREVSTKILGDADRLEASGMTKEDIDEILRL